jgi:hypothetical protein
VPEELGLEQILRNGSAIDGHERLLAAVAPGVDGPGDHFFPRTALTAEEHVGLAVGNL